MNLSFEDIIAKLPKPYYQDDAVCIINADCRDILPLIPEKSIDLVLTDPPYGTKTYQYDISIEDTIWVNIRRVTRTYSLIALMGYASALFKWAGHFSDLKLLGYIVWHKYNELIVSPGLTRAHQDIAIWGKAITQLHADKVREPYQFIENPGLLKYFGGGSKRGNKVAQRLGDSEPNLEGRRCTDLWTISVPWHGFNNHLRLHPNQKPGELINRLILLCGNPNSLILDPFMGSGTTAYCAKKLGRKCIGIEIEERYCEIAAKRLSQMVLPLESEQVKQVAREPLMFKGMSE